jgi:isopentenyl diphosphate isomerase/L-lactate dehydrogenase-like FMN-dependent dehydrogenase
VEPTQLVGRVRQAEVFLAGAVGRRQPVPADPTRLEEAARRVMSPEAFAYVAGGAGMESTIAAGREAFEHWKIVPRMLRDVSHGDTSVELFGRRIPAPLLTAPIGVLELAHKGADLAVARAAAAEGIPMIFSSQASVPMEACAAAMGQSPRWFQLYWGTSNDVVAELRRARGSVRLRGHRPHARHRPRGLARAGRRPRLHSVCPRPRHGAVRERPSLPGAARRRRAATEAAGAADRRGRPDAAFDGTGLPGLAGSEYSVVAPAYGGPHVRRHLPSPVAQLGRSPISARAHEAARSLKGILHPDDARRALDYGMDGIVVSTHGGRQVDGSIASLDALPAIVEAVDGRVPVLLDSGVRNGADIFKALALGASAVLLGRPYAYGLAIAGEEGARTVLQNTVAEFDLTMRLAGCASVADITREAVTRIP